MTGRLCTSRSELLEALDYCDRNHYEAICFVIPVAKEMLEASKNDMATIAQATLDGAHKALLDALYV